MANTENYYAPDLDGADSMPPADPALLASANSFTPGPWRYASEPGYCVELGSSFNGALVAAFAYAPSEEDANLISAAPDLLEALESYVTTMAIAGGGDKALFMAAIREADNKARAAIAKATGAQP